MSPDLSRRNFLKLAAMAPLITLGLPQSKLEMLAHGEHQPNVLVLVFDTLSARHMSLYGYQRATTPNLARFAERATVYHNHFSSGNFTSPGTASIFTGAYPWAHRAFNLHGTIADQFQQNNFFRLLPDHVHKVAYTHNLLVTSFLTQFQRSLDVFKHTRDLCLVDEQFSDLIFPQDYNTSFWSEGIIFRGSGAKPSSLFLSLLYKISRLASKQGVIKEYGQLFPRGVPNLNDIYFVLEDAVDWIAQQLAHLPQPYLGYFHFLPPHEPYTTRREFVDIFLDGFTPPKKPKHVFTEGHTDKFLATQRREYDEYIAYADSEFGRLYDFMDQSGVLDDTYVMITSDHGELFERGIRGHVTRTMYDPLLHVPLIISKPGQKQREDVYTNTSCVDLLPTLLHLYGQELPAWNEGQILPAMGSPGENAGRLIFAVEAKSNPKHGPLTKGTLVVIQDQFKLIHYLGEQKQGRENELYDLSADPEELENLALAKPAIAADLQGQLEEKLRMVNHPYLSL